MRRLSLLPLLFAALVALPACSGDDDVAQEPVAPLQAPAQPITADPVAISQELPPQFCRNGDTLVAFDWTVRPTWDGVDATNDGFAPLYGEQQVLLGWGPPELQADIELVGTGLVAAEKIWFDNDYEAARVASDDRPEAFAAFQNLVDGEAAHALARVIATRDAECPAEGEGDDTNATEEPDVVTEDPTPEPEPTAEPEPTPEPEPEVWDNTAFCENVGGQLERFIEWRNLVLEGGEPAATAFHTYRDALRNLIEDGPQPTPAELTDLLALVEEYETFLVQVGYDATAILPELGTDAQVEAGELGIAIFEADGVVSRDLQRDLCFS